MLLLIVGIPPDFIVRHLLIPHRYAAWNLIVDALVIGSATWLSGVFGSMAAMPHAVEHGRVRFNLGLLGSVETDAGNVASLTPQPGLRRRQLRAAAPESAMLLFPGATAVRVDFFEPVELRTYPLFRARLVSSVYVGSDRPKDLCGVLERENNAIRMAPVTATLRS